MKGRYKMTNQEIANEILLRIGDRPVPFESVREISLQRFLDSHLYEYPSSSFHSSFK